MKPGLIGVKEELIMFVMRAEMVDVVSGLPYSMGNEH